MKGKRKMNCPNCGGALKIKDNKVICEYCGHEGPMPTNMGPGSDDFYNLMVFNESTGPDDITVTLSESNMGFIIRSGEAIAKDVPPGYHTMVVSCGSMVEYRSICVPGDGKAVRVYVSRAVLGISIRIVEPGVNGPYNTPDRPQRLINNGNTLPVLALVFSIMVPLIGLILAIVDRTNSVKQGKKGSPLTTAALVLSIIRFVMAFLVLLIPLLVNMKL